MNKEPSEIAVGTDLEVFLFDNELKKIVPCVGILEGTKDKPFRPAGYDEGYAIQEDNVMVEFNIPPATSPQAFTRHVNNAKHMVLIELDKRYNSKYGLSFKEPTHKFKAKELKSPQAKLIGCEPDFNAYEGGKMRFDPPAPGLDRGCGGHVHLGGNFNCPDFVAALYAELFIGLRAQIIAPPTDPRRKWYGQPGIYRPKPYGIEYRTPNNQWSRKQESIGAVGSYGIACAKYLTETDAVTLQSGFRQIPWLKVRDCMTMDPSSKIARTLFFTILDAANKTGVNL